MKATFEKKMTIKFWFNLTDELEQLNAEQREVLEEKARESIFGFITKEQYTSGELC